MEKNMEHDKVETGIAFVVGFRVLGRDSSKTWSNGNFNRM